MVRLGQRRDTWPPVASVLQATVPSPPRSSVDTTGNRRGVGLTFLRRSGVVRFFDRLTATDDCDTTSAGDSVAASENSWPAMAIRLLIAVAGRSTPGSPIRYEPAAWFRVTATSRNRSRWSRWTRRLANAGLVQRITETRRNRVRQVSVTESGFAWIDEHLGGGAISHLDCSWDQLAKAIETGLQGNTNG